MKDALERFALPDGAFAGIWQRDGFAFVGYRAFPFEYLAHDAHIVAELIDRLAPRAAIPAFHDLWPRYSEADDDAISPRELIQSGSSHGGGYWRTGSKLDESGA